MRESIHNRLKLLERQFEHSVTLMEDCATELEPAKETKLLFEIVYDYTPTTSLLDIINASLKPTTSEIQTVIFDQLTPQHRLTENQFMLLHDFAIKIQQISNKLKFIVEHVFDEQDLNDSDFDSSSEDEIENHPISLEQKQAQDLQLCKQYKGEVTAELIPATQAMIANINQIINAAKARNTSSTAMLFQTPFSHCTNPTDDKTATLTVELTPTLSTNNNEAKTNQQRYDDDEKVEQEPTVVINERYRLYKLNKSAKHCMIFKSLSN